MSSPIEELIAAGFQAINQAIQQQQARLDTFEANVMTELRTVGRELAEEKKSAFAWSDLYVNSCSD